MICHAGGLTVLWLMLTRENSQPSKSVLEINLEFMENVKHLHLMTGQENITIAVSTRHRKEGSFQRRGGIDERFLRPTTLNMDRPLSTVHCIGRGVPFTEFGICTYRMQLLYT